MCVFPSNVATVLRPTMVTGRTNALCSVRANIRAPEEYAGGATRVRR